MNPAPLTILACGMTTAVGLTAAASCAAIRARLDGFRETRFMARDGKWIVGAEVPLEEAWRGIARLARLVEGPIRECLAADGKRRLSEVPLYLCIAEDDRPGRFENLGESLLAELPDLLGADLHPDSRAVRMGRIGAAVALREASRLFAAGERHRRVLVAGVDSYLVAPTLRAMDERVRLLTNTNSNGFLAGEAAGALLVGPGDAGPGLAIRALGLAVEPAPIEGEEPLRGNGLYQAFGSALSTAGIEMRQIGYRLSTLSGEQYWFKEADLATSRLLRGRHELMEFMHPADAIGETGAAALPCALGVAFTAATKCWAPGDPVLAFASNDDGRRAALILSCAGSG